MIRRLLWVFCICVGTLQAQSLPEWGQWWQQPVPQGYGHESRGPGEVDERERRRNLDPQFMPPMDEHIQQRRQEARIQQRGADAVLQQRMIEQEIEQRRQDALRGYTPGY